MRTPEGRDGVTGVVVAPPIGVQLDLTGIGVAVHNHHVLPLLVIILGDASLYIPFFQATGYRRIQGQPNLQTPGSY